MDKKHLNKIVGYLLDDIEIHYEYQSLQIIGSDIEYDIERLSDRFFGKVWDMLEYDYGLNTDDCLYVYGNLIYQINIKMKDYGSINESINSRGDYLDKVIEYLLDDTEIDYNNKSVNLLFLHPPMLLYFFPYPLPSPILEYCKDVYGLNDDETNYVLREYKNIIVDNFNNRPINESVDRRSDYLDKILDYIVDDTMINSRDWEPPFHPSKHLHSLPFTHHLLPYFYKYCNDNYGLTNDEVRSLWKPYLDRVDKISRKKPY